MSLMDEERLGEEVRTWVGIAARYEERLTASIAECSRLRAALDLIREEMICAQNELDLIAVIDAVLEPAPESRSRTRTNDATADGERE